MNGLVQMIKMYLSKSKMGSMNTLMQVRDVLSQYSNLEVLEFSGGVYTTELLDQADILLIIPPELSKPFADNFNIGKGQYTELKRFELPIKSKHNIFHLISLCSDQLNVVHQFDIDLLEIDWKTNYATIDYNLNDLKNFEEFGYELGKKPSKLDISNNIKNISNLNKSKLLLC